MQRSDANSSYWNCSNTRLEQIIETDWYKENVSVVDVYVVASCRITLIECKHTLTSRVVCSCTRTNLYSTDQSHTPQTEQSRRFGFVDARVRCECQIQLTAVHHFVILISQPPTQNIHMSIQCLVCTAQSILRIRNAYSEDMADGCLTWPPGWRREAASFELAPRRGGLCLALSSALRSDTHSSTIP